MNTAGEVKALRAQIVAWLTSPAAGMFLVADWLSMNLVGMGVGFELPIGFYLRIYTKSPAPGGLLVPLTGLVAPGAIRFIYTGRFRTLSAAAPAQPIGGPLTVGAPIALEHGTEVGTLGAFVTRNQKTCLLTCRHVLDPAVASSTGDDTVLQRGHPSRSIGRLIDESPLADNADDDNSGDWAVAELNHDLEFATGLPNGLGSLDTTPLIATNGLVVTKASPIQPIAGRVVDSDATIDVDFRPNVKRHFTRQILITAGPSEEFAQRGESGTLIVAGSPPRPVGILFAVNLKRTDIVGVAPDEQLTAMFPIIDVRFPLLTSNPTH